MVKKQEIAPKIEIKHYEPSPDVNPDIMNPYSVKKKNMIAAVGFAIAVQQNTLETLIANSKKLWAKLSKANPKNILGIARRFFDNPKQTFRDLGAKIAADLAKIHEKINELAKEINQGFNALNEARVDLVDTISSEVESKLQNTPGLDLRPGAKRKVRDVIDNITKLFTRTPEETAEELSEELGTHTIVEWAQEERDALPENIRGHLSDNDDQLVREMLAVREVCSTFGDAPAFVPRPEPSKACKATDEEVRKVFEYAKKSSKEQKASVEKVGVLFSSVEMPPIMEQVLLALIIGESVDSKHEAMSELRRRRDLLCSKVQTLADSVKSFSGPYSGLLESIADMSEDHRFPNMPREFAEGFDEKVMRSIASHTRLPELLAPETTSRAPTSRFN